MHANAPNQKKQVWRERLSRSGYFFGALLFHLIAFVMLATFVVWRAPEPPGLAEFQSVKLTPPPPPPPAPPPSSGAAASNPQFEPQPMVVPVVTPMSAITSSTSNFKMDVSKALNQALNHISQQAAQGTGLSNGAGSGLTGMGSAYGDAGTGVGLAGSLYDLKQTPDGQPTDMAENATEKSIGANVVDPGFGSSPQAAAQISFLTNFVKQWNMSDLDGHYYKSDQTLNLAQVCIPDVLSQEATIAFHVQDKVVARRWIAVYRGKIIPPENGNYRFIGLGDDFLVVNIDGKNVLDGSFQSERIDPSADVNEDVGQGWSSLPLACGQWVHMRAGVASDMQILIGEGPGGASGFVLMVQKQGDNSSPGDFPVFQIGRKPLPIPDMNMTMGSRTILFKMK